MQTYNVVFQLTSNEVDVYKCLISQINKLLNAMPNDVAVEVVCHGRSSSFCVQENNSFVPQILALIQKGVQIKVCENMLHAYGINTQQIIPQINIVPAGIAELVKRQHEGWAYIKAGF
jgi:intracellular sulfur oxidation DsrE/DsrF family protein